MFSFENVDRNNTSNTVLFPQELIDSLSNSINNLSTVLALSIHKTNALFTRRNESDLQVNSDVISASIRQEDIEGLTEPIVITLRANVCFKILI